MPIEFEDATAPRRITPWTIGRQTLSIGVDVEEKKAAIYVHNAELLQFIQKKPSCAAILADLASILAGGDASELELIQEGFNEIVDQVIDRLDGTEAPPKLIN